MTPAQINIEIPTRWAPWGGSTGDGDIIIIPNDWSAASFKMQVRRARGDVGTPLINLASAASGSQGIHTSYDASLLDPESSTVVGGTIVRIQIDETTLNSVPWGQNDTDGPIELYYDILVTPSGSPEQLFCYGSFKIYPGVTV